MVVTSKTPPSARDKELVTTGDTNPKTIAGEQTRKRAGICFTKSLRNGLTKLSFVGTNSKFIPTIKEGISKSKSKSGFSLQKIIKTKSNRGNGDTDASRTQIIRGE